MTYLFDEDVVLAKVEGLADGILGRLRPAQEGESKP
jgi:hypothetical protein